MRVIVLATLAAVALGATGRGAVACEAPSWVCGGEIVVFPAYTPEGLRIGTLEAPVRYPPRLALSDITGQPMTVIYNDPSRRPGTVDPGLFLMRLPPAKAARTRGVYPVGY